MSNIINSATDLEFDMARIEGKPVTEVLADTSIEWDSAYPTVENGVVTGIVDGNSPESFNNGNWEIVNDSYAVATN